MDELVKIISEKAGISESQAQMAAGAAIEFIKDKLPAPIASQVDGLLGGEGGGAAGMLGKLGGMFGK
ncbi:MAG TPA: hypothetical protein ENJ56_00095 [Anaerolineae bacterium]|nr:hypothetical protein [Anaerolineae bacterium]